MKFTLKIVNFLIFYDHVISDTPALESFSMFISWRSLSKNERAHPEGKKK